MRLLTTLSSTHWLCTAETVSPIIEKTTLLGKDIILALRTHMRTLGLIYHMHHWTWNWQSQTNLVGAAPFRVLHCGPPPLGPILPFPSVCSESSPSSQNCIRYENPCCCEKNMVVFFLPKHNGNWLERQEMQISTYLWKTVHLPLWNGFLPQEQGLSKAEQSQISCCFLWGCYSLKSSLADGETQKNMYSRSSSPEPGSCFQQ